MKQLITICLISMAFSTGNAMSDKQTYIVGDGIMEAAYIAINNEAEANGDYEMDYVETCEFLFDGQWSAKFNACLIKR